MNLVNYGDSILSIVPPLTAIFLAVLTKKVLLSLGIGFISATLLLTQFDFVNSLDYLKEIILGLFWRNGQINDENVLLILFFFLLGSVLFTWKNQGEPRDLKD